MSDRIAVELSTAIAPAKLISVDGEEYKLYGLEHLSQEQEDTVMALFSRHTLIADELEKTPRVEKGKVLAQRMRDCQLKIIGIMTTIPHDVADKLPQHQKAKLFEAVQYEIEDPESAAAAGRDAFGSPGEEKDAAGVGADPFEE